MSKVLILNGPSSSGKSQFAAAREKEGARVVSDKREIHQAFADGIEEIILDWEILAAPGTVEIVHFDRDQEDK